MIAAFPHFSPISLDIMQEFSDFVSHHPPYSDFNFVNLMSWNRDNRGGISMLQSNLVLFLPSYVNDGSFWSFLGSSNLDLTARTVMNTTSQKPLANHLQLVPEHTSLPLHGTGKWRVAEDIDNHDYVISLTELSSMLGSGLRRFRRAVYTFARDHGEHAQIRALDLTDAATQAAIITVFVDRELAKGNNDYTFELHAIKRLLHFAKHYHLLSYGIEIDRELRAFIICENVGNGWSIGHFWKADISYRGIYSFLMYEVAKQLTRLGLTMMNIQQDLGIQSLKFFKTSFSPVGLLKKYTITPALDAGPGILDNP